MTEIMSLGQAIIAILIKHATQGISSGHLLTTLAFIFSLTSAPFDAQDILGAFLHVLCSYVHQMNTRPYE